MANVRTRIFKSNRSKAVRLPKEVAMPESVKDEVLPFESKAAYHFGQIRAALYKAGGHTGAYDMMIAGHARALGLVLVTNNHKEFQQVPGLLLENWV